MTVFIGAEERKEKKAPAKKQAPKKVEEVKEEATEAAEPDTEGVSIADVKPKRTRKRTTKKTEE